ncbi:MAG: helix-turn-helix domain-containing protein [Rhodobacter sp.]|nr:helix-turn-helix domain-containing protein [Rhodobacter sp.]MCA3520641.1 helix-turn-helix domain-containing protein [Rhodobacter sp.]MCA3523759.1 helix-turn-helix domain-containing protein [Rhodobacter sp.]MCA3526724.1 helix-turn-helix domain-containing protein [Rhodobacter sp.]MCA3529963.1 helix-turn-helix domain-containing protein [Rhodobacter sp.]
MGQSSGISSAGEIIDRLKKRFSVETDIDLAAKLRVSRSAIANWRNRDSVPDRYARIAEGETAWAAYHTHSSHWSDVENEAMVLALARLVRDFSDIGTDYSAFMNRGHRAAAYLASYHADACGDLARYMKETDNDSAYRACASLFYAELQAGKKVPQ